MNLLHLYILLAVLIFSGCSSDLVYLTDDMVERYRLDERELKRLQFYNSEDIILQRALTQGNRQIENGTLKIRDGREVEEVVIKEGTPGVLVEMPKKDRISISFEENDNQYLTFGVAKNNNNRYVLLAKDWEKNRGNIYYDGKSWTTPSRSAFAALLIDMNKVQKVEKKRRTAPGRKVD